MGKLLGFRVDSSSVLFALPAPSNERDQPMENSLDRVDQVISEIEY